jgi:hypothetical protein
MSSPKKRKLTNGPVDGADPSQPPDSPPGSQPASLNGTPAKKQRAKNTNYKDLGTKQQDRQMNTLHDNLIEIIHQNGWTMNINQFVIWILKNNSPLWKLVGTTYHNTPEIRKLVTGSNKHNAELISALRDQMIIFQMTTNLSHNKMKKGLKRADLGIGFDATYERFQE